MVGGGGGETGHPASLRFCSATALRADFTALESVGRPVSDRAVSLELYPRPPPRRRPGRAGPDGTRAVAQLRFRLTGFSPGGTSVVGWAKAPVSTRRPANNAGSLTDRPTGRPTTESSLAVRPTDRSRSTSRPRAMALMWFTERRK